MSDEMVRNLKKPSAWFRVLFMAGFVIALYVTGLILLVLMLAQIVFSLLTGEDNINLRRLGAGLASYVSEILAFLTYNSEQKPFPFQPFPLETADAYAADPVVDDPVVVDPVVVDPVATGPVVEPVVPEPSASEPSDTQSQASATFEEAQAVADDEGFQNPSQKTDTPADPMTGPDDTPAPSAPTRTTGRKKKTINPEAPHTDD